MLQSTQRTRGSGKSVGATEAELLAQHEGLVRWVVRRQHLGPLAFADALHEGRIGLWQAIRHFDPARGTTFSSYAVPAITRAIWRAVAREQRPPRPAPSLPSPAIDESDLAALLHAGAVAAVLHAAVAELPAPLHEVVVAHLGLDGQPPQTFAAIGARLGRTKQRAHQLYQQALRHLAHPAASRPIRRLTDRLSRQDYQRTLASARHAARARRHQARGRQP
jgi:RNA polymerase sigma factor (sigma-70 family)